VSTSIADRRSQRRDQILAAAWDIAAESGLGAVSLHEVARRVGIRQPSLYGYVTSKLDLYDAMYGQAYEQLLARLDATPPGGTAASSSSGSPGWSSTSWCRTRPVSS
jgi:AcrR family transcriptional regulator